MKGIDMGRKASNPPLTLPGVGGFFEGATYSRMIVSLDNLKVPSPELCVR